MDTNETTQTIRKAFGASTFRPCAIFDESLDCIRVIAKDASVTEIRIDERFTVLQDNHPEKNRKYVGFTIKGAKHFCQAQKLSLATPIRVADVLDALLAFTPNPLVGVFIDTVAKPLVEKERIEQVDLSRQSVVQQAQLATA